jgi:6-pyruvoyltetrahydropterin/6-carboxytetrahydropterin synthase
LIGYDGACKNVHGHNWKVRVGIVCNQTDEIGLSIDFGIIKKHLNSVMDYLDHKFLNDLDEFKNINPTSENIAKFIYQYLEKRLSTENCNLSEIEVWESDTSSVVYYK